MYDNVGGSNLRLYLSALYLLVFSDIVFKPNKQHNPAGGGKTRSSYAKSAEYSICEAALAVQTKRDYISPLCVLPCPPFPIFPGEKIMWLGCVIFFPPQIAHI